MKVIVAHPSKQHSFYTAIALKQGNMLFRYITSVYDKPGTLTHFFKRFLSSKNRKKASTRKTTELLDSDVLVQSELCGLLLLIIRRVPFLRKKLYHNLFRWRRRVFGEFVAKYAIENEVDAVIMYDSTAVECFSVLKEKAPNIIRILDVSIAHRLFMRKVFEQDADRMKDNNIVKEESILWNDTLMKEYVQEVIDSNYFLSPSNVVKESLLYVGAPEQKIKIIPYGVDLNKFLFVPKKQHNLPLKLIFVGQIIYRKGIHHLLNIVSQFSSSEIILQLVGNYDSKSELYIQYKDCSNIKFLGFATRDILAKCY